MLKSHKSISASFHDQGYFKDQPTFKGLGIDSLLIGGMENYCGHIRSSSFPFFFNTKCLNIFILEILNPHLRK